MDSFIYQFTLIKQLGFIGWITTYPVNPITIVLVAVIIGIVIIILNVKLRKAKAENNKPKGAAILLLDRANIFNTNYASRIQVNTINGHQATWFFYQTRPAVYLSPGYNTITVYATWSPNVRKVKIAKTVPISLKVNVETEKVYTLYYRLQTGEYLLVEGNETEDNAWEARLTDKNIVG